jgi:proline racemase
MEQIEEKYLRADFDECMNLIDRRFQGLRTFFSSPPQGSNIGSGRMLHACYRNPSCDCVLLTRYLISIAFHRQETEMTSFL